LRTLEDIHSAHRIHQRVADLHRYTKPGEKRMNRLSPTLLMTGAILLGSAIALPAAAQFAKPDDAIKYRKSALTVMSTHFGRVAAMANGKVPFDAKAAADNAEIATFMSKLPFDAFVPGSDKGTTRAEPKIWTEMDKFKAAASKMQDDMAKLNVAAKTGNIDMIKAAVGEVGKSCKACHDNYRKDE
jgi:cytochrome c556